MGLDLVERFTKWDFGHWPYKKIFYTRCNVDRRMYLPVAWKWD